MDSLLSKIYTSKPVIINIVEEHHISQARLKAKALTGEIGFERVQTYYVATAVSELANNLFFHAANGGAITLTAIRRNGNTGVEIVAEDDGPGIPDVKRVMQDGFSTNGGLGGGLPGVERMMDEFEITSKAGSGTRIMARKWRSCT